MSIVSYSTSRKWVRSLEDIPDKRRKSKDADPGQPRVACNFDTFLQDENLPCTILQRDQDTKYVKAFDDVFTVEGRKIKMTTPSLVGT